MFNFILDLGSHSAKTNSLNSNPHIKGNRWKPEQTMFIHKAPNDISANSLLYKTSGFWQRYAPSRLLRYIMNTFMQPLKNGMKG
jgi:hypothetical protein